MAEAVEIRLLGELEVIRAGRRVALPPSKRTRALLGYLAISGRSHGREQLCDLLWQGPDDPRAALRWSLAKLRGVIGAPALVTSRERVGLGTVTTDVGVVEAVLKQGVASATSETLCAAAACFRGELLEGLALPDCYAYHEWFVSARASARAQRVALLSALVQRFAANPEQALRWAREQVAADPLAEGAHIAVITLLAQLGRQREAMAQYETCVRILAQEMGARPSPALFEARARIGGAKLGTSPPPSRAAPATAATAAQSSALFGRHRELAALVCAIDGAARGEDQPVLLFFGEPGIGKSRMLEEIATRTRALGGVVLTGRAFEAEMVRPYGPWIDALRAVPAVRLPEALRSELATLLPGLAGVGAADRAALFDAVVRLLVHLSSAQGPLALLLDDLHWFDDVSAALLHYVARAVRRARLIIACGARRGELSDNPAALKLLRGLARDGASSAIELGPLSAEATAELSRALAPDIDAGRIVREAAGNPLLALELARARARGDEAAWGSIGGLIDERLSRLNEPVQELLVWAAALGKSFDLVTLERVTGVTPLDLLERMGELERHGIVRASAAGDSYDFVHDLVRAGAYRSVSEPRRRVVHRGIARAMSAMDGASDVLAGEVAHHAALGGDPELAARSALAAARRSLRVFAHEEAVRLAQAGLQQLAGLPRKTRIQLNVALLRVYASAGSLARRVPHVQAELGRAVQEAREAGLHREAAEGLQALSVLQYEDCDTAAAHASTLQALDHGKRADLLVRARQLGDSARCLALLERDMDRALAMYTEARVLAGGARGPLLEIEWAGGVLSAFMGNVEEARPTLERALGLARAAEDRWAEYGCLRQLIKLELEARRVERAETLTMELLDVASKMPEGSEIACARALLALCRLLAGDPSAERAIEDSAHALRQLDVKGMLAELLLFAAERDLDAGHLERAERRARDALELGGIMDYASLVALARSALAQVELSRNDVEAARRVFAQAGLDAEQPLALSARARAAVTRLAAALTPALPD